VFTGASLWDPFGKVLFRRLGTTTDIPFDTVVNAVPGPIADGRCATAPVHQDPAIHASPCGVGGVLDPFCGLQPDEDRIESFGIENPNYSLAAGNFYQVRVRNENGDYFKYAELIPPDVVTREAMGRTLHVCTPDLCTPPPLKNAATCVLNGPGCGPTVGGIWNAPPRILTNCKDPLDVSSVGICPETPLFFDSATEIAGLPLLVFVQNPGAAVFVNTKIHSVKCDDETGSDWAGEDELIVSLLAAGAGVPGTAGGSFGEVWSLDIDSGDRHAGPMAVSIPLRSSGEPQGGSADYVLNVSEDDDNTFQIAAVALIGGGAAIALAPIPPRVGGRGNRSVCPDRRHRGHRPGRLHRPKRLGKHRQ
jgi:hypothetical protein